MSISITLILVSIIAFFIGHSRWWAKHKMYKRDHPNNKENAILNGLKYVLWWVLIWCTLHYGLFPFLWASIKFQP